MKKIIYIFFVLSCTIIYAQKADAFVVKDSVITTAQDPLRPSKAAFYSALVPGLGQIYNKDYWKVPIVYAALGTSTGFYIYNNKQYNRYRDAYKRRLAGFTDDEFQGNSYLSDDKLIYAQKVFQRQRDLSLLITIGLYVLNIVEANTAAHLKQFNVNQNLSIAPDWYRDDLDLQYNMGLTLKYNF